MDPPAPAASDMNIDGLDEVVKLQQQLKTKDEELKKTKKELQEIEDVDCDDFYEMVEEMVDALPAIYDYVKWLEDQMLKVNPTFQTRTPLCVGDRAKIVTFVNTGMDNAMSTAKLYYGSTPWGNIGHADRRITVRSYPGHRWFIVANGIYEKVFTVGHDDKQTFNI